MRGRRRPQADPRVTVPRPLAAARQPVDPRELLDEVLALVEKDLRKIGRARKRTQEQSAQVASYGRLLLAVAQGREAEELERKKSLAKLSKEELHEKLRAVLAGSEP